MENPTYLNQKQKYENFMTLVWLVNIVINLLVLQKPSFNYNEIHKLVSYHDNYVDTLTMSGSKVLKNSKTDYRDLLVDPNSSRMYIKYLPDMQ